MTPITPKLPQDFEKYYGKTCYLNLDSCTQLMLKGEYHSALSFLLGKGLSPNQTCSGTCAPPQPSERSVLGRMPYFWSESKQLFLFTQHNFISDED